MSRRNSCLRENKQERKSGPCSSSVCPRRLQLLPVLSRLSSRTVTFRLNHAPTPRYTLALDLGIAIVIVFAVPVDWPYYASDETFKERCTVSSPYGLS